MFTFCAAIRLPAIVVVFPFNAATPFAVNVLTDVLHETTKSVKEVVPEEDMFHAVISPVKFEVELTANVPVVVASAVNQLATVAQLVTVKVQIEVVSEVRAVMSHVVAVNVQETDKFDSAVTFQPKVEVPVTTNVPASNEVASATHNELILEFKFVAVTLVELTSVELTVVIFHVVALTVVPVNVHSAVIFPVKVTSPATDCNVTLERSKLG